MKKLLTLIGSAAVSFGLYADPAQVTQSSIEFENEDSVPAEIPGALDWTLEDYEGNGIFWYTDATAEDLSATVTAYETPGTRGDNYLAIETGTDPLIRTATALYNDGEADPSMQQVTVAGGVVFDQWVKFSAFDSDPTELASDAKVAVWLKAVDAEAGVAGETNLYVSTAILDSDLEVTTRTNLVLKGLTSAIAPDSWHQLKITAIPVYTQNALSSYPGFVISVDNQVLHVDDALFPAVALGGDATPTAAASKLMAEQKLMPSRVAYNASGNPKSLEGVGYQGSGAVDNIVIAVGNAFEATATITAPANATISSVVSTNGYAIINNGNGIYTVANGDGIRVTLAPAPGYHLGETTSQVFDVNGNTEIGANAFTDITVERDAYAVKFWKEETLVATTNVTGGTVALPQAAPEAATGYTFAGWFETNTVGEVVADAFDFENTVITNALDLFAQFTNTLYDITLTAGANGTIEATKSTGCTNGEVVVITATANEDSEFALATYDGWTKVSDTELTKNYTVIDGENAVTAPDATKKAIIIYVAEIVGGGKYESLADAVAAAGAGATVRLLDDYSMASTLVVPAEKSITLDLGGYTLTSTAPNSGNKCAILNYGTLGVSNGTFTATATTLIRTPGGTVTIYDGTYSAAQNGISCAPATGTDPKPWATGSTINFRGGSLTTVEMALLTGYAANSTITVTGGTLTSTDNACIGDNGTANCGGHTINVTGATLNASITSSGYVACGIYIANSTALVVSNTTINVTGGCGILARGGNVTVQDGTAIMTTGTAVGKVGDSRVVVPSAAVVFDSGSAYPGYNPSTTEVVINGGTFSSAVTSVQLVGDAEKISIPSTSTAQFSDSNAAGVEAGYELVLDGETGLYKVAVSTYTLTYVTDKGTAPAAVSYTVASNNFALAAAPTADGYTFQGWVIGTTTNAVASTFVVADHLENTTATAAWEENAPVGPTVDGKTVDPSEVFDTATSTKPITYTTAPTLSGEEGSQTITWGGKTVDVPTYYTASLEGTTVTLELNSNAVPEIGATSSDPAMEVSSTTVSVGLASTNPKLYYGLSSCSTVGGEYAAPASVTQGTGSAMSLSIDRGTGETTKFYKVYVTDVAPVTP